MVEILTTTATLTRQIRENKKFLIVNDDNWATYGSSMDEYNDVFEDVLDKGIFKLLIDRPNPVVIDLMGPSKAISTLFPQIPQQSKLGIALSFLDKRTPEEKARDIELNIYQISGDILQRKTWKELEDKLQGRKADLVIARPVAGLTHIPIDKRILTGLISRIWNLLTENNGILLLQTRSQSEFSKKNIDIEKWIRFLKEKQIDARSSFYCISGVLSLIKTPNSPTNLPFL